MPYSKYAVLNEPATGQGKPQPPSSVENSAISQSQPVPIPPVKNSAPQTQPVAEAKQAPLHSHQQQGMVPAGGHSIPSKEHTANITALMTYTTDKESTDLVRIYDGVIVLRDGGFLVERKFLVGKTPEQIQAHYSLSFVPQLICDASVPVGHQIVLGKLTNAAGKRVSIFKALTALSLSTERPLTPSNIAYVMLAPKLHTAPPSVPKPSTARPVFSSQVEVGQALNFLQWLADEENTAVPSMGAITGPGGFLYHPIYIDSEAEGETSQSSPPSSGAQATEKARLPSLQYLLENGYGLVLWNKGEDQPFLSYKYRDLVCFKIFGSLQPPPDYDEALYTETLDKPLPAGTVIRSGHPSEHIFPTYVRNLLNQRIGSVLGKNINLDPRLIEYPEVDTLKRFKLNVPTQGLSEELRKKIGSEVNWCLPYVVYL